VDKFIYSFVNDVEPECIIDVNILSHRTGRIFSRAREEAKRREAAELISLSNINVKFSIEVISNILLL
jgi:hypothetical protein